jgi:ParD-like antitoxin of type II bacterial toxin-antitoxin system
LWQNATFRDTLPHMAKSIRVSDDLYKLADSASVSAHRSLAQQIEYWAALGRAIEAAGFSTVQVQQVIEGDLRARERALLKLGLADPQSMYLFPVALARKTRVRFPELDGK